MTGKNVWKKFEKNNPTIALNVLYIDNIHFYNGIKKNISSVRFKTQLRVSKINYSLKRF